MKASKLRAQLHREGFELEGGIVGTRTPSSVLACGCTPALEVEQPTAQTCWCPGGCPTTDPAPGLTPLATGGSVTQPGLETRFLVLRHAHAQEGRLLAGTGTQVARICPQGP